MYVHVCVCFNQCYCLFVINMTFLLSYFGTTDPRITRHLTKSATLYIHTRTRTLTVTGSGNPLLLQRVKMSCPS